MPNGTLGSGNACGCGGEPTRSAPRSSRSQSRPSSSKSKSKKSSKSKCGCGADVEGAELRCPNCERSRIGLSCRVEQIRCFGEMVFDERRFICFVKRLHIILGRCCFSWLLSLCCIVERINWLYYLEEVRFIIQQNEYIENALDQCCFLESMLIEWMTAPCACGDCSHYTLLIVLSPLLFIMGVFSMALSLVLKLKRLLFGERCTCSDPMPKPTIGLGSCAGKCMCGVNMNVLKGGETEELSIPQSEASVRNSIKRVSMNIQDDAAEPQTRGSRLSSASQLPED